MVKIKSVSKIEIEIPLMSYREMDRPTCVVAYHKIIYHRLVPGSRGEASSRLDMFHHTLKEPHRDPPTNSKYKFRFPLVSFPNRKAKPDHESYICLGQLLHQPHGFKINKFA